MPTNILYKKLIKKQKCKICLFLLKKLNYFFDCTIIYLLVVLRRIFMRRTKFYIILVLILILFSTFTFAKEKKYDEMSLQFGFGGFIGTSSLLGIIESIEIYRSIRDETDYNYPGLDDEEKEALQNLNGNMQRAILVANILGSLEYGLSFRLLWHVLMVQSDIILLPFDGSYNGRLDLLVTPMIGVRFPWIVMPYIMMGMVFTFSFYPSEFTSIENWKTKWAATDNFAFRPGIVLRAGVDFKLPNFSIGAFGEYIVKDFQEFTSWYWHITNEGYTGAQAVGKIVASQFRAGISAYFYF